MPLPIATLQSSPVIPKAPLAPKKTQAVRQKKLLNHQQKPLLPYSQLTKLLKPIGLVAFTALLGLGIYKTLEENLIGSTLIDVFRSHFQSSGARAEIDTSLMIQNCLEAIQNHNRGLESSVPCDFNEFETLIRTTPDQKKRFDQYMQLNQYQIITKQWQKALETGVELTQLATSNDRIIVNFQLRNLATTIAKSEVDHASLAIARKAIENILLIDLDNQLCSSQSASRFCGKDKEGSYIQLLTTLIKQENWQRALEVPEMVPKSSFNDWDLRLRMYLKLGKSFHEKQIFPKDADLNQVLTNLTNFLIETPLQTIENADSLQKTHLRDNEFKMDLQNTPKNYFYLKSYYEVIKACKARGLERASNLKIALKAAKKMDMDNILSHFWRYKAYELIARELSSKGIAMTTNLAKLKAEAKDRHDNNQHYYERMNLWSKQKPFRSLWKPPSKHSTGAGLNLNEQWFEETFDSDSQFKLDFKNTLCALYLKFDIKEPKERCTLS